MRRNFAGTMLLCVSAMVFAAVHLHAQEIGIQMGSVRELYKEGMPTVLSKIKEMGITELEGGAGRMNREEFKKLLAQYGLKMVASGAGFERLANPDTLQKVISIAKDLGVEQIICYWIPHDGDNFTLEDMKKGVAVFSAAGKVIKENGMTFCYHVHGYEFRPYEGSGNKTMFDYLIENTDPRYVSLQMDVFWIKNPGQDPVALLKKHPDRWKSLHLKDRRVGTPNNLNGRQDKETNVVLGTGDVGIAAAMKAAKEIGIKHYFIEDESSRALEQVPQSVKYLKSLK